MEYVEAGISIFQIDLGKYEVLRKRNEGIEFLQNDPIGMDLADIAIKDPESGLGENAAIENVADFLWQLRLNQVSHRPDIDRPVYEAKADPVTGNVVYDYISYADGLGAVSYNNYIVDEAGTQLHLPGSEASEEERAGFVKALVDKYIESQPYGHHCLYGSVDDPDSLAHEIGERVLESYNHSLLASDGWSMSIPSHIFMKKYNITDGEIEPFQASGQIDNANTLMDMIRAYDKVIDIDRQHRNEVSPEDLAGMNKTERAIAKGGVAADIAKIITGQQEYKEDDVNEIKNPVNSYKNYIQP